MILKILGMALVAADNKERGTIDYIEDVAQVRTRGTSIAELEKVDSSTPIDYTFNPTDVPERELLYAGVTYHNGESDRFLLRRGWAFLLNDSGDTIDKL